MRFLFPFPLFMIVGWSVVSAQSEFVPAGGNAWLSGHTAKLTKGGISDFVELTTATMYLRLSPGDLNLAMVLNTGKPAKLKVTLTDQSREVAIDPSLQLHPAGTWKIPHEGYFGVVITGLNSGIFLGLSISGSSVNPTNSFVRSNQGNFFYWGRRGPSVHLRFEQNDSSDIEWFYSEITVPDKNDVIGSYYMANGFADGYFGFQVNSERERRVLFSVWSPFKTDDPRLIPEEDRVILVKKGPEVHTGEFGDEGSGGQSHLRYNWKAGETYGFLLRGQPDGSSTIYTAWFFVSGEGKWKLIASWRRPKKATYLTSLYSFLENFTPETGNLERRALYGNQWVCDNKGVWKELTGAKFTGDNTAQKNYRKDYGGGVSGDSFFLRNCGFFSDFTTLDQSLERKPLGKRPKINFKTLP